MVNEHPLRIALVHDFLLRHGGAERVLSVLHRLFPSAPIYTLFADARVVKTHFADADVRTSGLQGLPLWMLRRYRFLAPFCISAVESFDLSAFDIVISSSSSFAKGIITKPETTHIWYCHTPTRYLWDWTHAYLGQPDYPRFLGRVVIHGLRLWDFEAAQRPDYIIANSQTVKERIQKFYRREAKVIYPPVAMREDGRWKMEDGSARTTPLLNSKFQIPNPKQSEYFLIVSYLQKYKNIGIAVEAFSKLNMPLVIIGDGPERKNLERVAGSSVRFLGWQNDETVERFLAYCKAFIFPSDEDFGIAPVEAMAHGKPVLALRRGGATETVLEGVTGEFFNDPHPAVLADGLRRLVQNYPNYDPAIIRQSAERFSVKIFSEEMRAYLKEILKASERVI